MIDFCFFRQTKIRWLEPPQTVKNSPNNSEV